CAQWSKGGISSDIKRLCLITGADEPTTNHVVRCKFKIGDDGLLRNERMEKVRGQSAAWKEKSSKGGQASAAKRLGNSEWGKKLSKQRTNNEPKIEATAQPSAQPLTNSPSPSPSPNISTTPEKIEGHFKAFVEGWVQNYKSKW